MKLQPKEKNPSKYELLVCELLETDISVTVDTSSCNIWLNTDSGYSLVMTADGKWRLE